MKSLLSWVVFFLIVFWLFSFITQDRDIKFWKKASVVINAEDISRLGEDGRQYSEKSIALVERISSRKYKVTYQVSGQDRSVILGAHRDSGRGALRMYNDEVSINFYLDAGLCKYESNPAGDTYVVSTLEGLYGEGCAKILIE